VWYTVALLQRSLKQSRLYVQELDHDHKTPWWAHFMMIVLDKAAPIYRRELKSVGNAMSHTRAEIHLENIELDGWQENQGAWSAYT
jgi:hypothetical protein